jgi:hypothetical protein
MVLWGRRARSSFHRRRMTRLARCRLCARRASRLVLPSATFRVLYVIASSVSRCCVTLAIEKTLIDSPVPAEVEAMTDRLICALTG